MPHRLVYEQTDKLDIRADRYTALDHFAENAAKHGVKLNAVKHGVIPHRGKSLRMQSNSAQRTAKL